MPLAMFPKLLRKADIIKSIVLTFAVLTTVVCLVMTAVSVARDAETFDEHTERVFDVEKIVCDAYEFPSDHTSATWMQDGRLVKGMILVDGHEVGLAGPDGELLKPVKW